MSYTEHYFKEPVVKKGVYSKLRKHMEEVHGEELDELVFRAQQFHNPLNYDSGSPIKKKYGWRKLFTDYIKGKRYYFPFHTIDTTCKDTILAHFIHCKNIKRYRRVWELHAPSEIDHKFMYYLALVEMTYTGMAHEDKVMKELQEKGHHVVKSTPEEDYHEGIDLWVDGEPLQVKSPATERNMKKKKRKD